MLVQIADVGCKKRNCGGKVWAGVCGDPCEEADEGLVRFAVSNKNLVILFNSCLCCRIDGSSRLVSSGKRVEVDLSKTVALDDVLCVGFL